MGMRQVEARAEKAHCSTVYPGNKTDRCGLAGALGVLGGLGVYWCRHLASGTGRLPGRCTYFVWRDGGVTVQAVVPGARTRRIRREVASIM